jgi:hypothetical protein
VPQISPRYVPQISPRYVPQISPCCVRIVSLCYCKKLDEADVATLNTTTFVSSIQDGRNNSRVSKVVVKLGGVGRCTQSQVEWRSHKPKKQRLDISIRLSALHM